MNRHIKQTGHSIWHFNLTLYHCKDNFRDSNTVDRSNCNIWNKVESTKRNAEFLQKPAEKSWIMKIHHIHEHFAICSSNILFKNSNMR